MTVQVCECVGGRGREREGEGRAPIFPPVCGLCVADDSAVVCVYVCGCVGGRGRVYVCVCGWRTEEGGKAESLLL